ncbi:MAG: DUF302 domain-containing protein [Nanoarchaeota archaeon]|nr:DUF302 domain-containing protein [Nanoarchaeota archaeon]
MKYGYKKKVELGFDEAVVRVKEELVKEGFGILMEIDVREKFREKLEIDFGKYVILGACNPKFAHEILLKEMDVGLLLPCNVVVYEFGGEVFVSVISPANVIGVVENDELTETALVVDERLRKVIDGLC